MNREIGQIYVSKMSWNSEHDIILIVDVDGSSITFVWLSGWHDDLRVASNDDRNFIMVFREMFDRRSARLT